MATSLGVVCGAGFETPAEALYLGKKLLVVPMKGQYEQLCNAASLESLGVPVIDHINANTIARLSQWIASNKSIQVNYPDNISFILDEVLETHLKHIRKGIQANTPTHLNTAPV
jgi:predicted glycosyltransferase